MAYLIDTAFLDSKMSTKASYIMHTYMVKSILYGHKIALLLPIKSILVSIENFCLLLTRALNKNRYLSLVVLYLLRIEHYRKYYRNKNINIVIL